MSEHEHALPDGLLSGEPKAPAGLKKAAWIAGGVALLVVAAGLATLFTASGAAASLAETVGRASVRAAVPVTSGAAMAGRAADTGRVAAGRAETGRETAGRAMASTVGAAAGVAGVLPAALPEALLVLEPLLAGKAGLAARA